MEFFRKIQRKIKDGTLKEMMGEARWMWAYVRRYRWTVAIHILLGVIAILMGLGTSVASKYLIDAVTGYQTGLIGTAAAIMAGMLLGNIALGAAAARIGAVINIRVRNEIQAEVYSHVLDTDWESLEQYKSGDLMNRLTGDVSTVSGGVTDFAPGMISAGVQLLGALLIMLWYDPTMAVIALLGVPGAALVSRRLVGRMRDHSRTMKAMSGEVMSFYEDSLANLTSIKAFDVTGHFYARMTGLQGRYREEYLSYNRFSVRTSAAVSLVGMLVSGACFGWGVYRLWMGAISFGSMTMFLQLAGTLSGAFSTMMGMVSSAISITTSAGRIMDVVQLPSERVAQDRDYREEKNLGVCLDKADFAYHDSGEVLHRVDFQAEQGDLVALTGPSGEGKTTLLRMILGLIRPHSGRAVLLRGKEEIPLSSATRSAFAYVPQGNSMLYGTIAENLRLTKPEATEAELWEALHTACADFVENLPGQLQYAIGERGKGLSEGQAQRIAIARALLREAPILLLDEATSALDEATEEKLLQNLMTGGRVRTCIFATHRPGTMKMCTKQYRVEEGRVTAERRDQ